MKPQCSVCLHPMCFLHFFCTFWITITLKCLFYSIGACDFESSCSWSNTQANDNFDWLVSSGKTTSRFTGPPFDHTFQNASGHYIYLESSAPRVQGDKARYISQAFPAQSNAACLSFSFYMYGANIGSLGVYVLTNTTADSLTNEAQLWKLSGAAGNSWMQGQMNIPTQYSSKPFQLMFEGIRGNGYQGDIAVDDISVDLTSGCVTSPDYAKPQSGMLNSFYYIVCKFKIETGWSRNNIELTS